MTNQNVVSDQGTNEVSWGPRASRVRSREDRLVEIAANLRVGERVSVSELAAVYGVSEVTIRTDLDTLEERGAITRVRGGAVRVAGEDTALPGSLGSYESSFRHDLAIDKVGKRELAALAVERVGDGNAVFLDDSACSYYLAEELLRNRAHLLVATNSLAIAAKLLLKESFQVIIPGGTVRRATESVSGSLVDSFSGNIKFDFGFFSGPAVDANLGLLELDMAQAAIKAEVAQRCEKVVVLLETPGAAAFGAHRAIAINDISMVVADSDLPERFRRALAERVEELCLVE